MELWKPLNILSYGAGMPSTSLVGMACENARRGHPVWPHVPVYDAVIFCDLCAEPAWVYEQADFARPALRSGRNTLLHVGHRPVRGLPLQIRDEPDRQHPVLDTGRGREEGENAAPVYL